ncbi:MAG: hypothetical protein ACFE8A_13640, partial [Candidatus Hodarchaeota archaeon]
PQGDWDSLGNGSVVIIVYANDTLGNLGSAQVTVRKDIIAPYIIIDSPENNIYYDDDDRPMINISAYDSNFDSIWYIIGTIKIMLENNIEEEIDASIWNSLKQGEFYVYIYANDTLDNVNDTYVLMLFKDTLAPILTINSPNNGSYYNYQPIINVAAFDPNLDDIWYRVSQDLNIIGQKILDNNNTDEPLRLNIWEGLGQGDFQIEFWATDTFNNISDTIIFSLYKDTLAPKIEINSPNNLTYWNTPPSINVSAFDQKISQIWYRVYSTLTDWSANITLINNTEKSFNTTIWNSLEQGAFQIYFYANDSLGNMSEISILTLYKDTLIPEITINLPINVTLWNTPPPINISASDQKLNKIWYRVHMVFNNYWSGNITLTNNTEQFFNISIWLFSLPQECEFQIFIYANDSVGNINDIYVLTLYKDVIAPRITIDEPDPYDLFGTIEPNFDIVNEDANLNSSWYILINETNPLDRTNKYILTGETGTINQAGWNRFENGTIIIRFYANDTLGNETYREVIVRKDIYAPLITISNPDMYDVFGIIAPNFTIYIDGPVNMRWYSIYNGSDWSENFTIAGEFGTIEGTINQTAWDRCGNGTVIIKFYINDTVGNIGFAFVTVRKDIFAPMITINLPELNVWFNSPPTLNAECFDPNYHTLWYRVYSSSLGWSNNITLMNNTDQLLDGDIWNWLGQGEFRIYFYANDTAGNLNETYLISFKDTRAPNLIVNSPEDGLYYNTPPLIIWSAYDPNLDDVWYSVPGFVPIEYLENNNTEALNDTYWEDLDQGMFQINIYAVDRFNNVSYQIITLYKDTRAPTIIINSPENLSYWKTAPILDIIAYDPNLNTTWYGNGTHNFTLTYIGQELEASIWDNLPQGPFIIYIYANDTFGHINDIFLLILYKDTIIPEITIILPRNESYCRVPIDIHVSASDTNLNTTWYRVYSSFLDYWSDIITLTNDQEQMLSASIWNILPDEEPFQIYIYANDSADNINNIYALTIYKDVIAPRITINIPHTNDLFGANAPGFDITIIEPNLNATWYYLVNTTNPSAFTANYTFVYLTDFTILQSVWEQMENGTVTIYFYANDSAGNIGFNDITVRKDIIAPLIIINQPEQTELFGADAPDFDITIVEPNLNDSWYYLVNATNPSDFTANYTFVYLTDFTILQSVWEQMENGTVTIYFYANDSSGNSGFNDITVRKDIYAPIITIIEPTSLEFYGINAPTFEISISGIDINTTWYVLVGNTTKHKFTETTGTINQYAWNGFGNGFVNIQFYINDTSSNENYQDIWIRKDISAPTITINLPINDTYWDTEPLIEVIVIDNYGPINIDSVWYRVGSTNKSLTRQSPTTWSELFDGLIWNNLPNEGLFQIYIYAEDSVGNVNDTYMLTLYKDIIAPRITIELPNEGDIIGRTSPFFNISIQEDNNYTCWYTIDGGKNNITFTKLDGRIDYALWENVWDNLSVNSYIIIRFYAKDIVGNISYAEVKVIKGYFYQTIIADNGEDDGDDESERSEILFGQIPLIITGIAVCIMIPVSIAIRKSRFYHSYERKYKKAINKILFLAIFLLVLIFLAFAFHF